MAESSIEWTDATWNPVRGCARVSPGCENCYAERVAARFGAPGQPYEGLVSYKSRVSGLRYTNPKAAGSWTAPRWNGNARFVPEMLDAPLRWKKPRRIFVNSMSDLFHDDITNEQIAAVFGVMAACPQHTFQVLTKRPARMKAWFDKVREIGATVAAKLPRVQTSDPQRYTKLFIADQAEGILQRALWGCELEVTPPFAWPLPNVWLGVSAEDQQRADERIPLLLQTPAAVRFVSAEPLLGPLNLVPYLHARACRYGDDVPDNETCTCKPGDKRLDLVIVGGESGPRARPFDVLHGRVAVKECRAARVAVFMKQMGAYPLDANDAGFDGGPGEWPDGTTVEDIGDSRMHQGALVRIRLKKRKGNDMSEWPEPLRVRDLPKPTQET